MKKITLFVFLMVSALGFSQTPEGTWKMTPEAGAFQVGPDLGSGVWFSNSLADVTTRACFFDDQFIFAADGAFSNVQGADTWLEGWQGQTPDGCGVPVAPHDGSNPATWAYSGGNLTLTGIGAHVGLAKVINGAELANPGDAPASVTYIVTEITATTMTLDINFGPGFWRFKLTKESLSRPSFSQSNVKMYPNPVKNTLNIEAKSNIKKISVYNVLGQEVLAKSPNSSSTSLHTGNLAKGTYIIKANVDGKVSASKFIKE